MREIKFRFWDDVRKKMYNEVTCIGLHWSYDRDPSVYNADNSFEYDTMGRLVPRYSDGALMQYIGLKDRNGKEVYEGDIVRCTSGCPHKVEWVQEHGGTFLGGMPTFYLSGLNVGYAWANEEEVIGNIYENPELAP